MGDFLCTLHLNIPLAKAKAVGYNESVYAVFMWEAFCKGGFCLVSVITTIPAACKGQLSKCGGIFPQENKYQQQQQFYSWGVSVT